MQDYINHYFIYVAANARQRPLVARQASAIYHNVSNSPDYIILADGLRHSKAKQWVERHSLSPAVLQSWHQNRYPTKTTSHRSVTISYRLARHYFTNAFLTLYAVSIGMLTRLQPGQLNQLGLILDVLRKAGDATVLIIRAFQLATFVSIQL